MNKRATVRGNHRNLAGLIIASVLALTGCGGGGGGGDHGGGGGLGAGTFTRTFSGTPISANFHPFGNNPVIGDVTFQGLYTAAEVGAAGRITTLRFRNNAGSVAAITCPNVTIRLGHSNLAALVATFASNPNVGTALVVLNDATLTIPVGAAGSYFDIPLTTAFDYNGVNNLVVQVNRTTTCSAALAVTVGTGAASRRAVSTATDVTAGTADNDTTTAMFVDAFLPWMQFVFSGGDNKLDFGGAVSNFWPFPNGNAFSEKPRTQNLYLASEINGSGPITGIAFQMNGISAAGTFTYTLKFGHSTLAALTDTFAGNYASSPTTVANAVTFSIPAGVPSGEWVWVPIPDGVFSYNGTDNLIVEVSTSAGSQDTVLRATGIAGRRLAVNEFSGPQTVGAVDTIALHVALRFHGGAVAVITNGNTFTALAFPIGAAGGRLNLYRASELGSAGTITSVACRMQDAASTGTSYANYQVIMGHSNVASLSATSSDNFASQTMAVNGAISVPAGLSAGDWIEVPLSTPFAYDGKSNLAIWMGTTAASGAAVSHSCLASLDAVRHPGQIASGEPGAPAVFVQDAKFDMRLRLSR